jgi:hypothetical protein
MFRDTINKLNSIIGLLTTNWTAARAAKLDYLDAAISSRAPASTAVSNADYTSTRAALLDGIIQTSVIKSIQTGMTSSSTWTAGGSLAYYRDFTIASVNPAKCLVICQSTDDASTACSGYITSPTNLRLERKTITSSQFRWYVVEFK